jgi:hypothetical protein
VTGTTHTKRWPTNDEPCWSGGGRRSSGREWPELAEAAEHEAQPTFQNCVRLQEKLAYGTGHMSVRAKTREECQESARREDLIVKSTESWHHCNQIMTSKSHSKRINAITGNELAALNRFCYSLVVHVSLEGIEGASQHRKLVEVLRKRRLCKGGSKHPLRRTGRESRCN